MRGGSGQLRTDVAVTLLYGDADRLKQRVVSKLAEAWLGDADREFALATVDAGDAGLQGVLAELSAGSLLSPKRLVVVRDVATLSARRQKDSPSEQEQLAQALAKLPPGVAVVLVAGRSDGDRRRRGAPVGKALERAVRERGQVLEVSTPPEGRLRGWLQREMQRLGKQMSPAATEALIGRVGAEADRLLSELQKLSSYLGDRDEATEEDVLAVTVRVSEENVFDLVDAVGRRDASAALAALDGLLPSGSPRGSAIPLLGMVTRQLRLIWQAAFVGQMGHQVARLREAPAQVTEKLPRRQNLAEAVQGRDFLVRKYVAQSENFTDAQLARALDRAYQADLALKGQSGQLDDRTVMELLIADLCT